MKNNFNIKNVNFSAPSPIKRAGVRIKICGMKYEDNIVEIGNLLPDYLGFIFYKKSTRFFEGEIPQLPLSIKKVGVFVNETGQNIIAIIKKHKLDCIQLHGNESAQFCQELQKQNVEVIKVFSIDDDFNFDELNEYENVCDYFLFDTKGKLHGGNGYTFNWKLLEKYKSSKPLFLSGGIGLDEIDKIKKLKLPIFAIDINSKFEEAPGLKNIIMCTDAIYRVSI